MAPILTLTAVSKTYKGGHQAVQPTELEIEKGEIIALLGPN